ncbi:protein SODIUM POTASSIUM ROOT DEFECTIVE 3-like [Miscanthus floridulus]|uniref:protein SODIUM POTASSIUM ROOT DEFECTIVE 3-like n=1 Tax=Miscanthus floridulus TaxID=154761 RepID=UPI0034579D9B
MRRPRIGRVLLDCFSLSLCTSTCVCVRALEDDDEEAVQRAALVTASDHHHQRHRQLRLKDIVDGAGTLGFHLQPKTVELRVSMHCNGCARKVHKHISKMEGVTWFEVDLESKKVVVKGDVTPLEVLQSVSKVKFAQLWMAGPGPHCR